MDGRRRRDATAIDFRAGGAGHAAAAVRRRLRRRLAGTTPTVAERRRAVPAAAAPRSLALVPVAQSLPNRLTDSIRSIPGPPTADRIVSLSSAPHSPSQKGAVPSQRQACACTCVAVTQANSSSNKAKPVARSMSRPPCPRAIVPQPSRMGRAHASVTRLQGLALSATCVAMTGGQVAGARISRGGELQAEPASQHGLKAIQPASCGSAETGGPARRSRSGRYRRNRNADRSRARRGSVR